MAFRIVDRTYTDGTDREPEAFGFIEGYTSNTVGATYLRINCKAETDNEKYDWFMRMYGEVPHDVNSYNDKKHRPCLRDRQIGDVTGEGMRLDKRQVIRLIWELIKWLVKGD